MTLPLIDPATRRRFQPYWSAGIKDFPQRFAGWPYAAYLRKAGFDTILGSSIKSGGDNYSAVRYGLHLGNCLSASAAAAQTGFLGQIVTSWVIRRAPMENQFLLIALAGDAMRNPVRTNIDAIAARYQKQRFGDDLDLPRIYNELGSIVHCLNMTNYCRYTFDDHCIAPPTVEDEPTRVGAAPGRAPLLMREIATNGLHAADKALAMLDSIKLKAREIDVLRFSAEEVRYKSWLTYAVCEYLRGTNLKAAPVRAQLNRLKALLRKTFAGHWTPWTLRDELRYRYAPDETWLKRIQER